jgi:hypothetical protein
LETLSKNRDPASAEIGTALKKYQDLRKKRAKTFVKLSSLTSRDEALSTLHQTIRFLHFPLPSSEFIAGKYLCLFLKGSRADEVQIFKWGFTPLRRI